MQSFISISSSQPLSTFTDHPSAANTLVLASSSPHQPEFVILNATNGAVIKKTFSPSMVTHLRSSYSLLISAASDGNIRTHDFRRREDGSSDGSALAHVGGIQGLEVSGNYVYSCGWGLRFVVAIYPKTPLKCYF
jgi:PAB-dependent poly(A)-specific ribonuclease subunit 2